jgi:O-acetyl-ADP-ribose deacetylase (regulator of RNase III)
MLAAIPTSGAECCMRTAASKETFWTNPSVLKFAEGRDPVTAVLNRAQQVVFEAIEEGWTGPPFDPFKLAQLRHLAVMPREDIPEARLTTHAGRATVEYNPLKSRFRVRYSVAHEVAHALFSDWIEATRNRSAHRVSAKEWQLEMLCNLAAAEFLMPTGTLLEFQGNQFDIHTVMEWRKVYEVSMEAMLLRLLRLESPHLMVFSASSADGRNYVWDYVLKPSGPVAELYGTSVRRDSPVKNCVAIGYTDKGNDDWRGKIGEVRIECVGIPGFPGSIYPRVVGFAREIGAARSSLSELKEVRGNALTPRGPAPHLLAHVVNNKARSWGAGFGKQVAEKYPEVAEHFRSAMESSDRPRLGEIFSTPVDSKLTVVQMIAQSGYGESDRPRLRYVALQDSLQKVRELALQNKSSVHMPRIGTGYGGGAWSLIRELIQQELVAQGVNVIVYQLQDEPDRHLKQKSLF